MQGQQEGHIERKGKREIGNGEWEELQEKNLAGRVKGCVVAKEVLSESDQTKQKHM